MASILPNQKRFAQCLASKTGLHINVIYAWIALETALYAVVGNGKYYNYLNVSGSGDAGSSNGWAKYSSPEAACEAVYHLLVTAASWTGYAAILASAGKPASEQIAAITNSRWCAPSKKALSEGYLRCYSEKGKAGVGAIFLRVLQTIEGTENSSKLEEPASGNPGLGDYLGALGHTVTHPKEALKTDASFIGGSLLHFAAGAGKRIVFVLGGTLMSAIGLYFIARETGAGAGIANDARAAVNKVPAIRAARKATKVAAAKAKPKPKAEAAPAAAEGAAAE